MQILVTGYHNPHYLTIVEYIENSVEKTGHGLTSFEDHQFVIPGRIRNKICFLNRFDLQRTNNKLKSLVKEKKPDLIIVTQGFLILRETVQYISRMGIPVVLWVIDAPSDFSNILDAAPYYDYIFCGGTEAVDIFHSLNYKNVEWLPFAFDPDFHYPDKTQSGNSNPFSKDLAFVGSMYPNRLALFESLNTEGVDFGIWGSGWDRISSDSPVKRYIQKTHTSPEEWIRVYSNSKITLISHYPSTKEMPVYQASPKVYEAMACEGFVICDNQRDLKTLFKNGEHLVIFNDTNDLNEKIKYYLANDEERAGIAAEGYNEVLSKHSYTHRIKQMLTTLESAGILSADKLQ